MPTIQLLVLEKQKGLNIILVVNVLTFSPLTGGCSEGLDALRFFFKHGLVTLALFVQCNFHAKRGSKPFSDWLDHMNTGGVILFWFSSAGKDRRECKSVIHCLVGLGVGGITLR